jgi:hypothetical protein
LIINKKPSITITSPDGINNISSSAYTITWQALDIDDDAAISLYYDNDSQGFDGIQIISGLSEDTDTSYIWDTSQLARGLYYIYAQITDNKNEPFTAYSKGPIIVDRQGSIRFIRVSNILSDSAVISWMSDLTGTGWADYGTDVSLGSQESSITGKTHYIPITGLTAKTKYYFRIRTVSGPIELTADNRGSLFTFTTAGSDTTGTNQVFRGFIRDNENLPVPEVPVFIKVKKKITPLLKADSLTDKDSSQIDSSQIDSSQNEITPSSKGDVSALTDTDLIESEYISALTGPDGSFTINSINLTDSLQNPFILEKGDTLYLSGKTWDFQFLSTLEYDPADDFSNMEFQLNQSDNTVVIPIELSSGFTMISFPASGIINTTSQTLLADHPEIIAMYRFDSSIQSYQSCLKVGENSYIGNFSLSPCEAYFVKSTKPLNFMLTVPGRISNPLTLELKKGFNLTALAYVQDPPFNMTSGYTSIMVLKETDQANAFYLYNSLTGQYESTLKYDTDSFLGSTIEIKGGRGFFIKMRENQLFNPFR